MWDIILDFLPIVIGILIGVLGTYYLYFKGKLKEVKEFIDTVWAAVQDDTVTKDEIKKIIKEFKDIWM